MVDSMKILVSIGGGPEAYAALVFAALLSHKQCTDTCLLTVREPDSGLSSGGLELRVAREQMLGWGLELPGMRRLKKARDILAELGEIPGDSPEEWEYRSLTGDPAGEYVVSYHTPCGGAVSLHLRSGTDIAGLVADECEREGVTIAMVGAPDETPSGLKRLVSGRPLAYKIAARAECSVIVARHLKPGSGIFAVLDGSPRSARALPMLCSMAATCGSKITIATTAGMQAVDAARKSLPLTTPPIEEVLEIEPEASAIIEAGGKYSLIALAAPEGRLRGTLEERVLEHAPNSVMLFR